VTAVMGEKTPIFRKKIWFIEYPGQLLD